MSPLTEAPDTLRVDPVAMNIVNRIAAGCTSIGHHQFQGGILIQGCLGGHIHIHGHTVIWSGGLLDGNAEIHGNLYILGQAGREENSPDTMHIKVHGTVFAGAAALSFATLHARNIHLYDGAQLLGPFHTLIEEEDLLREADKKRRPAFQPG